MGISEITLVTVYTWFGRDRPRSPRTVRWLLYSLNQDHSGEHIEKYDWGENKTGVTDLVPGTDTGQRG